MTVLVILCFFSVIRQYFIGFIHFFKVLFCLFWIVSIYIWMVLTCFLTKGFLNFILGCIFVDAKDVIIITSHYLCPFLLFFVFVNYCVVSVYYIIILFRSFLSTLFALSLRLFVHFRGQFV